jgi:23S rRNA (uridine2552-2'-O)-methyltransferase
VYKLEELLRRLPQVRPGARVVDLGCWPGGWLQLLAERVGPEGCVLGVDIEPVDAMKPPVVLLELDFAEPEAPERIAEALGGPADAVLSDAAPKLTGVRDVDRAAEEELYEGALRVAERVLRESGALVVKGFPGPEADRFRARLRARYGRVAEVRPEARRRDSKEFYWVAGAEAVKPPRSSKRRTRRARRS